MNLRLARQRTLRAGLLIIPLLLCLLHASGVWPLAIVGQLDLVFSDARLRAAMPRTLDPRIVIVDVDEKSLAELGHWPWNRERLAALADELFVRQRAAVVGFDLLFAEADDSGGLQAIEALARTEPSLRTGLPKWRGELDRDARFARALAGRAAVLGYYFTADRGGRQTGVLPQPVFGAAALAGQPSGFIRWDGYAASLPVLAAAAPRAGFFNALADADGIARSLPLVAEQAGRFYESLALAVFRAYTGDPTVAPQFADAAGTLDGIALTQGASRVVIPVDARGAARVPFRGESGPQGGSFRYLSAADVVQGRLAPGALTGKLVLVGSTAPGLFDLRATPVSEVYPGVEVHASLLSGLLDGRVPVVPDWARGYEVAVLLVAGTLLGVLLPRLRAIPSLLLSIALAAVLVVLHRWFHDAQRLVLPIASALLLILLVSAGTMSWGYFVEGRSRRSLARLFRSYVPPELVAEMARDPERYSMRAENRVLTIMFCDMRDFTRVSEALSPEDLRALINRFFSVMTAAIRQQRGTLDKYIGDAIMAFWGAPLEDATHAEHAVRAAVDMAQHLRELNTDLAARGLPTIGLGVGINSGMVCVGDMGSDIRRSYTVMGDAVNLASRIEALTRHYGVDLLVGESTREACGKAFEWVEVDRVRVKGKTVGVTLFTPAPPGLVNTTGFADEMRLWRLALDAWRHQHADDAQSHLRALGERFPGSPLSGLYGQLSHRVEHHRQHPPPPDWDGTHTFDTK